MEIERMKKELDEIKGRLLPLEKQEADRVRQIQANEERRI